MKERISYVMRVVTSKHNRAAKAAKKLPNMVLTARPLCTRAMTTTLLIKTAAAGLCFNKTHLYAPSVAHQLLVVRTGTYIALSGPFLTTYMCTCSCTLCSMTTHHVHVQRMSYVKILPQQATETPNYNIYTTLHGLGKSCMYVSLQKRISKLLLKSVGVDSSHVLPKE